MKDKKKYKDMLKCSTLKHKNNNDFISFIYTCKKTNKELNIFSVPKYLIKHNEIEFHLSLLNINNYIEILKKKYNYNEDIIKNIILKKLNKIKNCINLKTLYINKNFKFFRGLQIFD